MSRASEWLPEIFASVPVSDDPSLIINQQLEYWPMTDASRNPTMHIIDPAFPGLPGKNEKRIALILQLLIDD